MTFLLSGIFDLTEQSSIPPSMQSGSSICSAGVGTTDFASMLAVESNSNGLINENDFFAEHMNFRFAEPDNSFPFSSAPTKQSTALVSAPTEQTFAGNVIVNFALIMDPSLTL